MNLQRGREVTVHRPIRYHNLIWITYIRLGYMSSESLCAPWCWTHKRMRLHVFCVIRQGQLLVSAIRKTTKFCGCGISHMHYLGHCCQAAISHCTVCCAVLCCAVLCCVNLNWVWDAYCLGVRWLLAHTVYNKSLGGSPPLCAITSITNDVRYTSQTQQKFII